MLLKLQHWKSQSEDDDVIVGEGSESEDELLLEFRDAGNKVENDLKGQ